MRLRAFFEGRSLWLDEASLAVNFLTTDLWRLISTDLQNGQSAPIGFVLLTWLNVQLFGAFDQTLRLLPLAAGLAVPAVGVLVSKSIFATRWAQAVFVGLLAFSPVLIYYSSEFKQYSFDVLASTVVLYWWANWHRISRSPLVYLGGATILLFSLTSLVVLVLLCAVLLTEALLKPEGRNAPWQTFRTLFSPPLIVSWSAAILLHLVHAVFTVPTGFMLSWWSESGGFAPWPVTSLDELGWYPASFIHLFELAAATSFVASPRTELGFAPVWVAGLLAVAIAIWSRSRWLVLPATAILAAYGMALFQVYPFSSRLALYLLPLLFLVLALAIEHSHSFKSNILRFFAPFAIAVIASQIILMDGYRLIVPLDTMDTRWALQAVAAEAMPGQVLALDRPSVSQVNWYLRQGFDLGIDTVEFEEGWRQRPIPDLQKLQGTPGVWTIRVLGEEHESAPMRTQLESLGFVTVCYVYSESTSVALQVPVELAESQVWSCNFPEQR